jgi:hypothetical protein
MTEKPFADRKKPKPSKVELEAAAWKLFGWAVDRAGEKLGSDACGTGREEASDIEATPAVLTVTISGGRLKPDVAAHLYAGSVASVPTSYLLRRDLI